MKIYKHGIPGIGVTGKQGKTGKSGPGIYFGTLDSFFTFIGDDILINSSIDYDDIDYDITYSQNEERLNFIYKSGDILYIIDDNNKNILYMIEITDDITTCTKNYLIKFIKEHKPFTIKYKLDEHTIIYPINIVSINDDNEIDKNTEKLFNLNNIYSDALLSIIYSDIKYDEDVSALTLNTKTSFKPKDYSYSQIPYMFNTNATKDEYINNGDTITQYKYVEETQENYKNIITFNSSLTNESENINNILNIGNIQEKYINISTINTSIITSTDVSIKNKGNLYINNLFINSTNLGNIESYYTLFNQELILDNNGNCYTLNEQDFNDITQYFNFNPSSFFKDKNHTHENYHFGYIHMFWNNTNDNSIYDSNYYHPNYITGTLTENVSTNIIIPKTDQDGNYIRNWNSSYFQNITNITIREELINLWDTSTINDISQNLPSFISNEDKILYKDYHGIIITEKMSKNLSYYYVKTLDGDEYRYYENNVILNSSSKLFYKNYYQFEKDSSKLYVGHPNSVTYFNNKIYYPLTKYLYSLTLSNTDLLQLTTLIYQYVENSPKVFEINTDIIDVLTYYYNITPLYNLTYDDIYLLDQYNDKFITLNQIADDHYEDLFTKEWFTTYSTDTDNIQIQIKKPGIIKITSKVKDENDVLLPNTISWYICVLDSYDNINLFNNTLYDSSFNSSIIYVQDPSDYKINLVINDKFNMPYRNHDILQWVQTPNGFKYYSKHTYVYYNIITNTYDISTNWNNSIIENPGFLDTSIIYDTNKIFDFNVQISDKQLTVNASTYGDQEYVKYIQVYQDSVLLNELKSTNVSINDEGIVTLPENGIVEFKINLPENLNNYDFNDDILNKLYENKINPTFNNNILFTVKYSIGTEKTCSHLTTYEYNINGYNEYRTLPEIKLNIYNDMESLENLNKSNNGILCNQFQYFTDIKINGFNNSNWGKLTNIIKNPVLNLILNIDSSVETYLFENNEPNEESINNLTNIENLKLTYSLIKPNVDIFKLNQKQLEDENNLFNCNIINSNYIENEKINRTQIKLQFTLNELDYIDSYKLRVLMETTNPTPIYYQAHMYISELNISYIDNIEEEEQLYVLNQEYLINDSAILYDSNIIKTIISPISIIAGYKQQYPKLSNLNLIKWYGNENEITVSLKPYKLNEVIDKYRTYQQRKENNTEINWQGLKYKLRFLQDNVKSITVEPLNINYIKDLLPNRLYNDEYLAKDKDDIYDTYLQIIYNSNLLNPTLMEDTEVIQYNNKFYLSSKYGQYGNNTAVFIRQRIEHILRTDNLLNSMKSWNKLYKLLKYDSDNTYNGHEETYGNGYQYLPKSADKGQYLEDGLMLLENVKTINNNYFFDLISNEHIESELCKPIKTDEYTPDLFFRTLLYQMKWIYPKYDSKDGFNVIHQLPLIENIIDNQPIPSDKMLYNLTYSIYPRIMFNDEEQINMVLMLRLPSIIEDYNINGDNKSQYQLEIKDLCFNNIEQIKELTDPINVMN